MARRRKSKAKQQEEFIRSLLGLLVVGSFLGIFNMTNSLNASIIAVVVVIAIFIAIYVFREMAKAEKLKKSGIADIDKMDGHQFEYYLASLFKSQGYSAQVTKSAGDYGADLVLKKKGKKIVVQAKRYSKNVGIEAVQQIYGSMNYYGATEAWVVTNRGYTDAAMNLARSNGVRLIDREQLIEMILKMNPAAVPKPRQVLEEIPAEKVICRRCGQPMVLRTGPKGNFYGCSSFPKCRNIQSIS